MFIFRRERDKRDIICVNTNVYISLRIHAWTCVYDIYICVYINTGMCVVIGVHGCTGVYFKERESIFV